MQADRRSDLHFNGNGRYVKKDLHQKLEGGAQSFTLFPAGPELRQRVADRFIPEHISHQDRDDLCIRCEPDEDARRIQPGIKRFIGACIDIRVRFDLPGWKSQYRPAAPEMAGGLPDRAHALALVFAEEDEVLGNIREGLQERPAQSHDPQIRPAQNRKKTQCIGHTRMVREIQDRSGRKQIFPAENPNVFYIMMQAGACTLRQVLQPDIPVECLHLGRKFSRCAAKNKLHEPAQDWILLPPESCHQIFKIDVRKGFIHT